MAVFRDQVREIPTKYKILWFVVDMHHRQRYFFICGCNRTVTKKRPRGAQKRAATSPKTRGVFYPRFLFVFKTLQAVPFSGAEAGSRLLSPNFASWRGFR
jgi:hypothetical protein